MINDKVELFILLFELIACTDILIFYIENDDAEPHTKDTLKGFTIIACLSFLSPL